MSGIFAESNYREYLRKLASQPEAKRGFQSQLAKAMGCQAAYLSQVLRGKSELSEDQALKLTQFLRLSHSATEYFLLLLRQSRASTLGLRNYLEERRLELVRANEEVRSRVKASPLQTDEASLFRYFSSGLPSLLHIATSSEHYRTVQSLATRFHVDPRRVLEVLQFLEEINLVERTDNTWRFASTPLHFPRESPVNLAHQQSRRQQAIRSIEESNPEDIHFSSVFTLDTKTFRQVRADFLNHIEQSHQKIHAAGTDEVYTMCIDLFRSV